MVALADARRLASAESGLATVVTLRADGSPHASVVNAGVLPHPITGEECVGFVTRGVNQKIRHIRSRHRVAVVFRSGWDWVAVEGDADVVGPADQLPGIALDRVPELIRLVYAAAVGGQPGEWRHLDAIVESEQHTAVLVRVARVYGGHP